MATDTFADDASGPLTPEQVLRVLSHRQQARLARMPRLGAFNALSACGHRSGLARALLALGVLRRGQLGLADAWLTPLGRAASELAAKRHRSND